MNRAARALLAVVAFAAAGASAPVASAADSGTATAVVVIDTGASVRSAVIHFSGTINGITALELAGGNPVTYGYAGQGAAVCKIDGVGNQADSSCLTGPHGEYWEYWRASRGNEAWGYSRSCACTSVVGDGDVEGWRYGTVQKPGASAAFCEHVPCPPPGTSAPAGGTDAASEGGGTPAASAGGGSSGSGGSGVAPAPTPEATSAPAPLPDAPSTTSYPGSASSKGAGNGVRVEAASASRGGTESGSGSPAGVAIAGGLLVIVAGSAVWLRRRTRAPG